jgi:hypothetical protein
MDPDIVRRVRERAGNTCEYCGVPQADDVLPFEIDHIVAQQHGGATRLGNLAWACAADNKYQGPHVAGIDPDTGRLVRLFNPRRHSWNYHFRWNGAVLVGRTPIGRATVAVLRVNLPYRIHFRAALLAAGIWLTR